MSDIELTDLDKLADHIVGTPKSIIIACEELDIPEDEEWEGKLLDKQVEICVQCQWWHHSCMLEFVDEKNGGLCPDCLRDEGIEF